jgi:hypothetical protein
MLIIITQEINVRTYTATDILRMRDLRYCDTILVHVNIFWYVLDYFLQCQAVLSAVDSRAMALDIHLKSELYFGSNNLVRKWYGET